MEKAISKKLLDANAQLIVEFNSKMESMGKELKELILKTLREHC